MIAASVSAGAGGGTYILWGFILCGVALGLLFLELLVPSGGLLGLLCGIAVIGSIISFFKHDTTFGMTALLAYAILMPVLIVFMFKLWIHSPLGKRMVLGGDAGGDQGDAERALVLSEQDRARRLDVLRELVGAEGVTVTDLRPIGFVKINGERVDAMAETGTVDANTPVVVTDVYDNQIKVRPLG